MSGSSAAAASTPRTRRKRRISSWNGSGRPVASRATTSPSRMNGAPPRSRRAMATMSGRLRVTSDMRRLQIATRSPSRWSWMRAPSYLYSSAEAPPWAASASSTSPAISASIGSSGTNTRGAAAASASAPCPSASAATVVRSPVTSAARRTAAGADAGRLRDGLQHEPLGEAHAHLAVDHALEQIALLRRRPRGQLAEPRVPHLPRARPRRLRHRAKRLRHIRQASAPPSPLWGEGRVRGPEVRGLTEVRGSADHARSARADRTPRTRARSDR